MTDESTRPGDVCPESRDDDSPTAFQEACGMLGVRSHQENTLTDNKWFGKGWDAGIERDLGSEFYPTEHHVVPSTPGTVREAQLAFILGLTAGLIAESREYDSPHCLFGHSGRGGCPDEYETDEVPPFKIVDEQVVSNPDYSSADTHRDRYPGLPPVEAQTVASGDPSGPSDPSADPA
jgi:hypothetical protein